MKLSVNPARKLLINGQFTPVTYLLKFSNVNKHSDSGWNKTCFPNNKYQPPYYLSAHNWLGQRGNLRALLSTSPTLGLKELQESKQWKSCLILTNFSLKDERNTVMDLVNEWRTKKILDWEKSVLEKSNWVHLSRYRHEWQLLNPAPAPPSLLSPIPLVPISFLWAYGKTDYLMERNWLGEKQVASSLCF